MIQIGGKNGKINLLNLRSTHFSVRFQKPKLSNQPPSLLIKHTQLDIRTQNNHLLITQALFFENDRSVLNCEILQYLELNYNTNIIFVFDNQFPHLLENIIITISMVILKCTYLIRGFFGEFLMVDGNLLKKQKNFKKKYLANFYGWFSRFYGK